MIINAGTKYLGIIGNPLGHSLSPVMYNDFFRKRNLNYIYLPFEVSESQLGSALNGLKVLGFKGFNVTIPFKQSVIPFLDELSVEAKACQAVNLVINENGKLKGYNTDGQGFLKGIIDAGINPAARVLFIGAGGAAKSIAFELAGAGMMRADFLDLDPNKAEVMANFISKSTGIEAYSGLMSQVLFNERAGDADIIINCSPAGMHPDINVSPVEDFTAVRKDTVFCDIIYNPLKTKLLQLAEAHGNLTINGLPMFINQALLTLVKLLEENLVYADLEEVLYKYI
jgi:shikimate dehydrogenase